MVRPEQAPHEVQGVRVVGIVLSRKDQVVSAVQRQNADHPVQARVHLDESLIGRNPIVEFVGVHRPGKPQLFHVVEARDALRLGPGLRQGRQEQPGEDRDDGDDDQQLDQGEATSPGGNDSGDRAKPSWF